MSMADDQYVEDLCNSVETKQEILPNWVLMLINLSFKICTCNSVEVIFCEKHAAKDGLKILIVLKPEWKDEIKSTIATITESRS